MTGAECQHSVDSVLACYYAGDPVRRPRCTLTATVQVGAVALCASCNAARSTLGKGQRPVPLTAGQEFDVLGWVATARQAGASWTAIGAQLGLSRQGAQQRFARIRR